MNNLNYPIKLTFKDVSGKEFSFNKIKSFYEHCKSEMKFWEKKYEELQKVTNTIHHYPSYYRNFEKVLNKINSWKEHFDEWGDETIQRQFNSILSNGEFNNLSSYWLWSGHAAIGGFILCHEKYGREGADAFIQLIIYNKVVNNLTNSNVFFGLLSAYEFINQDSDITRRRKSEKISLGHLRNSFESSQTELFEETESIKQDFFDWFKSTTEKENQRKKIIKYLNEKAHNSYQDKFNSQLENCLSSAIELEKTYEEKLRLEKPAMYWNKSAKKYRTQGILLTLLLFTIISVGLIKFSDFFILWLSGHQSKIQLNSIQGIIIFASIVTLFGYSLKVLSKLIFSSFHLMRDSEEREQLTYLYLSLAKDNPSVQESRELILQALFSRSETGLLSNEHGPTMPSALEALKSMSSGKQ